MEHFTPVFDYNITFVNSQYINTIGRSLPKKLFKLLCEIFLIYRSRSYLKKYIFLNSVIIIVEIRYSDFYLTYHILSKIFFFKIPLKVDLWSLWDTLNIRDTLYVSKNTPLYKNDKRANKRLGVTHFYLIFQILILSFSSFLFSLI